MSRCIMESDWLFPSLCCPEELNAGQRARQPLTVGGGLFPPGSFGGSKAPWALLSTVQIQRSKIDFVILSKSLLRSRRWPVFAAQPLPLHRVQLDRNAQQLPPPSPRVKWCPMSRAGRAHAASGVPSCWPGGLAVVHSLTLACPCLSSGLIRAVPWSPRSHWP